MNYIYQHIRSVMLVMAFQSGLLMPISYENNPIDDL